MKPTFALDFRDDSIVLLHRTARGWLQVGETAIDAPDLTEALGYMRSTALGLSPRGISTKLVIPNGQILYATLHAPGPDATRRRKQIKAALIGLTPYPVEDLVFDWTGTGSEVQVAVIARETLAEAEAFAIEHRFNPVSYVAIPDNGTYLSEPWFGPTVLAATLLSEGEKVERDSQPISVVAREMPKSDHRPAAGSLAEPAAATVAPVVEPEAAGSETSIPAAKPTPSAEVPTDPVAEMPAVSMPSAPKAPSAPLEDLIAAAISEATPKDPAQSISGLEVPALPATAYFDPLDLVEEAPIALDVMDDSPLAAEPVEKPVAASAVADKISADRPSVGVVATSLPKEIPPTPSEAALFGFSSRRNSAEGQSAPALAAAPRPVGGLAPSIGSATGSMRPRDERPVLARPTAAVPQAISVAASGKSNVQKSGGPGKALRGLGALVSSPAGFNSGKRARVSVPPIASPTPRSVVAPLRTDGKPSAPPLANASTPAAKPGAKPMSGLGSKVMPVGGKPRYLGLILTGILLVLLVLVAAWSTFFLASYQNSDPATPAAEATAAAAPSDLPAPEDEMLADMQDPAAMTVDVIGSSTAEGDISAEDLAASDTILPPVDAGLPDATLPDATLAGATLAGATLAGATQADTVPAYPAATVEAAAPPADPAPDTLVATESAAAPTPATEAQDEIFLATADTPPQTPDPRSLPVPEASGDALPAMAVPPPPFGTVYQFDADGRIRPTPEGIMTPEGVLLIAGPPPLVPPLRPDAIVAAATTATDAAIVAAATDAAIVAAATDAAIAAALAQTDPALAATAVTPPIEAAPATPFPSDTALAKARPLSRPAGLVPPPASDAAQIEGAVSVAPAADSRIASLRPHARPPAVLAAGEQARVASQGASLAAASTLVAANTNVSDTAIAVSRKPQSRPADMSRAVEAAVAAVVRQPEPEPEQQPAITAPEADSEPEVATTMPALPVKASVAKAATYVNAINLSKINLIGVYGTSSDRYALVRQSNGKYKKVKVGDSLDGGRVAAITASELRYQKGGRMVTLELPTG